MTESLPKYTEEVRKERPGPKPTILDAPGIQMGKAIEWSVGNTSSELTAREKALILQKTGLKKLTGAQMIRALNVKNMMPTNSISQIARRFKGRKGYGLRTIAAIHAALSEAKGERRT